MDYDTHFNSMCFMHQLEKAKKRKRRLAKVKSYSNLKKLVNTVGTDRVHHAYASGRTVTIYKKCSLRFRTDMKRDTNRLIRRSSKHNMTVYNNGLYRRVRDLEYDVD